MSQELRSAILLLLDEHHRKDPSTTVADVEISAELAVEIKDVRRQLDILESQGLTREANTFGGHNAWISPSGLLATENLTLTTLRTWKATAELRRTLRESRIALDIPLATLGEAVELGAGGEMVTEELLSQIERGLVIPSPPVLNILLHRLAYSVISGPLGSVIRAEVTPIEKELVWRVLKSPTEIFALTPREFEELVAELLSRMGLEVRLTPESRDGGRDILATMPTAVGQLLAIVECKKYSPDRPVGVDIVERMLFTIREKDRASIGMIATTSRFTEGASRAAENYQWQILLRDYEHLQDWLRDHGTYVEARASGLWLPKTYSPNGRDS